MAGLSYHIDAQVWLVKYFIDLINILLWSSGVRSSTVYCRLSVEDSNYREVCPDPLRKRDPATLYKPAI